MKNSTNAIACTLSSTRNAAAKLIPAAVLSGIAFLHGVQELSCKAGTQFSIVQSALDASPAPTTVEVCPGIYAEQVTITKPVTRESVAAAAADLVRIVPPEGGLSINATLNDNNPAAAQIYVDNVSGTVNVSNLFRGAGWILESSGRRIQGQQL